MKQMNLSTTTKSRVVGMINLRDCVHQLINLQMDECVSESDIKAKQEELNRLYDAYTRKYGLINDRANRLAFEKRLVILLVMFFWKSWTIMAN